MKRFMMVVDDFYADADAIRRKALRLPYREPESFVGWRTRAYQPRGIKQRIEKKFRLRIKYWEEDLDAIEACNGVFFSSFSAGNHAERVGVHYDLPVTWVMFIVYLTPGAPYDAGTSIWQHRSTGLITRPTGKDALRLGLPLEKLEEMLNRDTHNRRRWMEIDRVGNVYNRAVMFPGGLLHSASKHFGSSLKTGRIYQSFHFPVTFLA
ncbi:MAG TPA: DUF6445 family protein [Pyrinomonadaceae bacterium]